MKAKARSCTRDNPPVTRWNSVPPPLVDGFTINRAAFGLQGRCHVRAATESGYDMIVREHAQTVRKYFGQVNGNSSDKVPANVGDDSISLLESESMPPKSEKAYAVAAGRRLRATREALGYVTGREFAQLTNVSEDVLSSWERGKALVRPWYISTLKERWGITQDWIYDGEIKGLEFSLGTRLKDLDSQSSLSGEKIDLSDPDIEPRNKLATQR